MSDTCSTCEQPILPGESSDTFEGDTYHENPDDCIAARDRMWQAKLDRLLCIARGCLDYGGGYRADEVKMRAFHHGIQTVINALEDAAKNDTFQLRVLESIGSTQKEVANA